MRTLPFHLVLLSSLEAGELIVVTPSKDLAGAMVQSLETGEALKKPEPTLSQEGQVSTFAFKNVEPGKYRITYNSYGNPIGFSETLLETLVAVSRTSTTTIYLYRPEQHEQLMFPKDVEEFLTKHRENLMELTVVYDGSKARFVQGRGGAGAIGYLRNDCEYSLEVWNHSFREFPRDPKDRSVIYKKTFRTVVREMDPFVTGVPYESEKKSGDGNEKPATQPESK